MAELIKDYIVKHLFDIGGYTASDYYYRITDRNQTKTWKDDTKELVAFSSMDWVDGCMALVPEEVAGAVPTGVFRVLMYKELPGGVFNITIHKRAGVTPLPSDDLVEQWQQKHGSIFGF